MKMPTRNIVLLPLIALLLSCGINNRMEQELQEQQLQVKRDTIDKSFSSRLKWTGVQIKDDNYSIWGSSPIIGEDGKVHVFVARWPEKNVEPAWRKSSEIAHYIADTPEGEYVFSDVVVTGSGEKDSWDRYAPSNPEIKKIGDYYALVYIANDDYHQPPHPSNQRIGMVYSKSVYGPWEKAGKDGMVVEVSKDPGHWTYGSGLGVDNPCINEVDGEIVIYFKNRNKEEGKIFAKYGYATSKNIEGPYTMSDTPITNNKSYLEDATTFTWNNKYYLLTNDNFGTVTGYEGGGILWSSNDSKKFSLNDVKLGFEPIPTYYNKYDSSKATKIYGHKAKFERPKILMLNDQPSYLFASSGWNVYGDERTVAYILKIEISE